MKVLVTGGAGFIGSALVRRLINDSEHEVLVLDKLTYAGSLSNLAPVSNSPRYRFLQVDICDAAAVRSAVQGFDPDIITHLAAESHVDRSIDGPGEFIQTNVVGSFVMLQAALEHFRALKGERADRFRFHHISTDEVFGSLGSEGFFTEDTSYDPRSPYSASKAASDHLASAWGHTYGLPVIITNCSNNYGPYHFPEKLIPLVIIRALAGEPLPVYGKGDQIRDWLFVDDHARALQLVFEEGVPGRSYNIGGFNERTNLTVVNTLCAELDRLRPRKGGAAYADLITYVADRPGHDQRYAIDATRIEKELGWRPLETFETGMARTVAWYLSNESWWRDILSRGYRAERLGLSTTEKA